MNKNILSAAIAIMAMCSDTATSAQTTGNTLQCGSVVIERGEEKTVDISLINSVNFSAFQCDITIPADGKFIATDGQIITGSPRFASTHRIIEKKFADNKLRVLVYANDNASFNNDSQVLFSYVMTGLDPQQETKGETTISNIIFSQVDNSTGTTDCIEHKFSDLAFDTSFTGISTPSADGALTIYADGMQIIVNSPADTTLSLTNAAGIATTLNVKAGRNTFSVDEPGVYIVGTTKVICQ